MNLEKWGECVGEEARKNFHAWLANGFYEKYLSGKNVLDIGFAGYLDGVKPITPDAIGVGLDYPGYDGKTLPFADNSQDTVLASHCLEHIDDYRSVISDWFRVLKIGGHLIILVPHQYLYERRLSLPSSFNEDHRRLYTPSSLMKEIEEAIDPLHYRVRMLMDNDNGFDYSIPPEKHAVGCYEILLVLEKICLPHYSSEINAPQKIPYSSKGTFTPLPRPSSINAVQAITSHEPPKSVIAFKMDHLGDFLLAQSALTNLRLAFPQAKLTLVCGEWNARAADELGIFDEIVSFSLFERNAALNEVTPLTDRLIAFEKLMAGRKFDLAIDLRVDSDSRVILKHVKATTRAGIGNKRNHPYLDIAVPIISPTLAGRAQEGYFDASCFNACFGENRGFEIRVPSDLYPPRTNLVYGPYKPFLPSRYTLRLLMENDDGGVPPCDYDIVFDGGNRCLAAGTCEQIVSTGVLLQVDEEIPDLEIRIWSRGDQVPAFTFRGCTFSKVGQAEGPHQTEMMAMLVALVQQRALFSPREERVA